MRSMNVVRALILALVVGYAAAGGISEAASARVQTGDASRLIGMPVRTPGGEDIGNIIDVVPGPEGHEAFAIVSYWVFADTQKRIAVPFDALTCEGQNCVLMGNREILDAAPMFIFESELAQHKLADDIYRYFGVQPYWTDEEIKR